MQVETQISKRGEKNENSVSFLCNSDQKKNRIRIGPG